MISLRFSYRLISIMLFLAYIPHLSAKKEHNLVEVISLIPDIVLDIRYATDNNFTHQKVYTSARCYLLYDVAKALAKVQDELRSLGLGLKIWDGYRPLSVQWALLACYS